MVSKEHLRLVPDGANSEPASANKSGTTTPIGEKVKALSITTDLKVTPDQIRKLIASFDKKDDEMLIDILEAVVQPRIVKWRFTPDQVFLIYDGRDSANHENLFTEVRECVTRVLRDYLAKIEGVEQKPAQAEKLEAESQSSADGPESPSE